MTTGIFINQVQMESMTVRLIGQTPLFINRMSAKAKRDLLLGSKEKTKADKAEIRHSNPIQEFRDSMLVIPDSHPHTSIWFPAMAIKSAMGTAALVVPGIKKTEVNRMVYLPQDMVPIFGVPELRMDVMKLAGMSRAPDVRTRAFLPQWATEVEIQFIKPMLNRTAILTLLENAGLVAGIGDSRQEKGKGSFGSFRLDTNSEEDGVLFTALQDLAAQMAAIESPPLANKETRELMDDYYAEVNRRNA